MKQVMGKVLAGIAMALLVPVGAGAQGVGDCNGDGAVTVDELVVGVNIALENTPLVQCPAFDANADGAVTVDELILGVTVALAGGPERAFIIATDFQTGSFGTVGLDATHAVQGISQQRRVASDSIVRPYGGRVYIVNRFGADNIQVLDPSANFATRIQCSTGSGSNPNDIAFASATKAYVPLFARAQLLVVNPSAAADCGGFVRGSIDLSAFADSDGIPDMSQAAVVGDRAYVSVQRLANFVPAARGALIEIDTTNDTVVKEIELTGQNPFAQTKGLTVRGGALFVSEIGSFGVNDGGLERVDLGTATPSGFLISEAEIGGDITDFVLVTDQTGYAILSKADFTTAVVAFDLDRRAATATLLSGGNFADIELSPRGELFVSDRSVDHAGVRIFHASDNSEVTAAPINLGLPPFDIAFIP
jgi:DNA-binding beta-propeller fold protein YncE